VAVFVLSMIAYPNVQRKAQAEIDNFLHGERLPSFGYREELKYLGAVMRKVLRRRGSFSSPGDLLMAGDH
jgi:hypothetical protein